MRKPTKKQKKAYKKITGSKYPKSFQKGYGETIPNYADFANDYIAFVEFTKKGKLKLTISHRMTSDHIIKINKKGKRC